jgi:hypothetical protein
MAEVEEEFIAKHPGLSDEELARARKFDCYQGTRTRSDVMKVEDEQVQ